MRRKHFPELEAKERAIRESDHARSARGLPPPRPCINCGGRGPHFIGPSFGDEGFFTCEPKNVVNYDR